jgi:type IV pilus assembly protein PilB
VLTEAYGLKMIDLSSFELPAEVLELVPNEIVSQYNILPVSYENDTLTVAVNDPTDLDTIDTLRYLLKCNVEAVIAEKDQIEQLINHYFGSIEENVDSFLKNIEDDSMADGLLESQSDGEDNTEDDAPIIRLVSLIILEAYKKRASDIHLEPLVNKFRVRYRIDGVLVEVDGPPKYLQANIISRLKIMAGLDITEKRVPQDGRIHIKLLNKKLDLRVSTIPTSHGESIVMRILDKSSVLIDISTLGFMGDDIDKINRIISMPDGVFLVTGPTGSGKTTSLYSFLNSVNETTKKIITVEDPIEYHLDGINQVQVQSGIGMTFEKALKAMMRQSPNIVMVGEIRDMETATIAINAALTGHLVFSTLHTNDAPGAIMRLIDVGIKPFLVASSVRAVMAQRLVRKICSGCGESYTPSEEELRYLNLPKEYFEDVDLKVGTGCFSCSNTGYKGRMGIYEIFIVTEDIQQLIFRNATSFEIRQFARKAGMKTLREDGISKVIAGLTTISEVIRTTIAEAE